MQHVPYLAVELRFQTPGVVPKLDLIHFSTQSLSRALLKVGQTL